MPALTVSTEKPAAARSRSASPSRPPVSPITPPLAPSEPPSTSAQPFPPPRQGFTHEPPPQQIGIPQPPPEPINFEANTDVIALKSAISVLQVQKSRATRDIQALNKAKTEALEDPAAFLEDLATGKVQPRQDYAFGADGVEDDEDEGGGDSSESTQRAWSSLPKPQQVVRCPPINWSQYAVVGDSLDKLHADQVARPSQGAPAVYGSGGTYDTRMEGKQERYVGVAAAYEPGRDLLEKKAKPKK